MERIQVSEQMSREDGRSFSGWILLRSCGTDKRRSASTRVFCCLQFQNPLQYFPVTHFFPSHLCSKTSWGCTTHFGFYHRQGNIGHNEVLFPSVSLGGSWLQMLFSLSPIISCLIEDNIMRQWGLAHHSASMACSMERVRLESGLMAVGGVRVYRYLNALGFV